MGLSNEIAIFNCTARGKAAASLCTCYWRIPFERILVFEKHYSNSKPACLIPCYHTNHKTQLTAASLFQSALMVIVRKPPANCARPARPWQGRSATIEFAEAAVGVQLHASPPVAITEVKLAWQCWHLHSNFN